MNSRAILLCLLCVATVFAKLNAPFVGSYEALPTIVSADIVGAGFNAKTGQSGLMKVLTWTYNFNQTWQSPTSLKVYKVPDQLTLAEQPLSQTLVCQVVSQNFSFAFNLYTSQFSFSAGVTAGGFSAAVAYNRQMEKINEMTSNGLNFYSYSSHYASVYSLVLPPAYVLKASNIFMLAVDGLPTSYSNPSDLARYQQFVTAYGTHYVCLADMGGSFYSNSYLSKSLVNKFSLESVSTQMSLEFSYMFFNISTGGHTNRSQIQFEQWFADNQQTFTYWNGGAPGTQSNTTLNQWVVSLPDFPGLLNTTLCPIATLISDPAKSATLASYVTDYMTS